MPPPDTGNSNATRFAAASSSVYTAPNFFLSSLTYYFPGPVITGQVDESWSASRVDTTSYTGGMRPGVEHCSCATLYSNRCVGRTHRFCHSLQDRRRVGVITTGQSRAASYIAHQQGAVHVSVQYVLPGKT